YRKQLDADHIRLLFNINAEFAQQVAPRPIGDVARSIAFSSSPDAILISGPITGQPANASALADVSAAAPPTGIPVLVNTGFKTSNARELLAFADGAIVGSSLKFDGITWNAVDRTRVVELMRTVSEMPSK